MYPNGRRSKTHSPVAGRLSPFYQGAAMPSFSPQPPVARSPLSSHSPFTAASPVPTLSHGCKHLFVVGGAPVTHLLQSAWSLSPEPHVAPITPTSHPYAQPQVVPNLDDLGLGVFTAAGNSHLPTVHSSPAYDQFYEECKLTPLIYRI